MSDDKLHDLLSRVCDKPSFLLFANALLEDRVEEVTIEKRTPSNPYGPGARGWEDSKIETFLEAAISGVEGDQEGGSQQGTDENPWAWFASFLYLGKIYE